MRSTWPARLGLIALSVVSVFHDPTALRWPVGDLRRSNVHTIELLRAVAVQWRTGDAHRAAETVIFPAGDFTPAHLWQDTTLAWLALPLTLGLGPALAFNLLLATLLAAAGLAALGLFQELGADRSGAAWAAAVWVCSPFVAVGLDWGEADVLAIFVFPLVMWLALRHRRGRSGLTLGLVLGATVFLNSLYGFALAVPTLLWLSWFHRRRPRAWLGAAGPALALIGLRAWMMSRRTGVGMSAPIDRDLWKSWRALFYPPPQFNIASNLDLRLLLDPFAQHAAGYQEGALYLGWVLLLGAGAGLVLARQRRGLLLAITLGGLLVGLGTWLKWDGALVLAGDRAIPLPYGVLVKLLPPLKVVNHPFRFAVVTWLGAAGLLALALTRARARWHAGWLGPAVFALHLAELGFATGALWPAPTAHPDVPGAYRLIAADPDDSTVLELPRSGFTHHTPLLMQALVHRHRVLAPFRWALPLCNQPLRPAARRRLLDRLATLGVRWVVLHDDAPRLVHALQNLPAPVWAEDGVTLFELPEVTPAPAPFPGDDQGAAQAWFGVRPKDPRRTAPTPSSRAGGGPPGGGLWLPARTDPVEAATGACSDNACWWQRARQAATLGEALADCEAMDTPDWRDACRALVVPLHPRAPYSRAARACQGARDVALSCHDGALGAHLADPGLLEDIDATWPAELAPLVRGQALGMIALRAVMAVGALSELPPLPPDAAPHVRSALAWRLRRQADPIQARLDALGGAPLPPADDRLAHARGGWAEDLPGEDALPAISWLGQHDQRRPVAEEPEVDAWLAALTAAADTARVDRGLLQRGLQHADWRVRWTAARLLRQFAPRVPLSSDPDPRVQARVVWRPTRPGRSAPR